MSYSTIDQRIAAEYDPVLFARFQGDPCQDLKGTHHTHAVP